MLTIQTKSDVRRHLEFPAIGLPRISPTGGSFASGAAGYRFFQAFGFLEYKLENLGPDEEARLTGASIGAVALIGLAPLLGTSVSVTISAGSEFLAQTVTANFGLGDSGLSLVTKLAATANQNTVLTGAGFQAVAPYGSFYGVPVQNVAQQVATPIPQIGFVRQAPFSISASSTGTLGAVVNANGQPIEPKATVDQTTVPPTTLYGYMPILNFLEGAIAGTTQNLDTAQADVWTARMTEIPDRQKLYRIWQEKLSDFLGIPLNPNKARRGGIRAVI